jgi:hypothetical protein
MFDISDIMLIKFDITSNLFYIGLVEELRRVLMPYREKTAWLSLIAMALTFGPYFAYAAMNAPGRALPNLRQLGLYATAMFVQLLILGAGHLYLRFEFPEEARIPPDERDSAIVRRSMSSAYWVLTFGTIYVGCIMPFLFKGWAIVNSAIFMIATAEVVRLAVVVTSYRRQA